MGRDVEEGRGLCASRERSVHGGRGSEGEREAVSERWGRKRERDVEEGRGLWKRREGEGEM